MCLLILPLVVLPNATSCGFKHIYNARRQIKVRSDNIEGAGRWKRSSVTTVSFDSEECVLE